MLRQLFLDLPATPRRNSSPSPHDRSLRHRSDAPAPPPVRAFASLSLIQHTHPYAEGEHDGEQCGREAEWRLVAGHQLAELIHRAGWPGQDRLIRLVAADVFG